MPPEVIVLGVICAVRPTGAAAIYALLCSAQPRRSLLVWLIAGFVFSATVGLVIVSLLHDVRGFERTTTRSYVIDMLIGSAALGFAAGVASGRMTWRTPVAEQGPSPWIERLRDPSLKILVGAGVATHLPGLLYLAALNAILGGQPSAFQGALQVLIFNALWYSTGVAALAAFILRPDATREAIDTARTWLREHERGVVLVAFFATGAYFFVAGAAGLTGVRG